MYYMYTNLIIKLSLNDYLKSFNEIVIINANKIKTVI